MYHVDKVETRDEDSWHWGQTSCVCILSLLVPQATSYVTMDNSMPQFPYLQNGDNNITTSITYCKN